MAQQAPRLPPPSSTRPSPSKGPFPPPPPSTRHRAATWLLAPASPRSLRLPPPAPAARRQSLPLPLPPRHRTPLESWAPPMLLPPVSSVSSLLLCCKSRRIGRDLYRGDTFLSLSQQEAHSTMLMSGGSLLRLRFDAATLFILIFTQIFGDLRLR
ncbi:hypothetical protein BJ166DRAFT_182576 [Pestalotiopsis sp. NC0098]|nr:hypothetical protein BJ166DRAFT_182576 [Pestalotiopsis sp. NC0098]